MFIGFMVSRLRRRFPLLLLAIVAVLAAACEKVPLLAPSGSSITLTAASTALPVNGSTDIIAQVIEASGTPPHSGTRITFTTNLGAVQPSEADTDSAGRVIVKFVASGGSGTATISAISGGVAASGTSAIKIAVGSAAVGSISLSASLTSLPAAGGSTTIGAIVNDTSGNFLPGVTVSFSSDTGGLNPSSATTDASGRAQTVLTTSRTAKVTATAGVPTTSGTTSTPAATNTITITVNSSGTATFGAVSPALPVAGQPVSIPLTVTPSTTGAAIQSVTVNFGDGTSQPLGNISGTTTLSHTWASPGTYTVTATITDSNGDSVPAVTQVTVGARPPANVVVTPNPATPQVGQAVTFTVATTFPTSNTAFVQSVTLNYGDGSSDNLGSQTTATAVHIYQTAGSYTATATVRDTNGGTNTGTAQVIVSQRAQLVVTIGLSSSSSAPSSGSSTGFSISAAASGTGNSIASVTVDFGDGTRQTYPGNTTSVQHIYTAGGTYTVTATATDSTSATGSASIGIIVTGPNFTTSSGSSTTHTVNFDASSSIPASGTTITSYVWNFGDSTTGTGQTTFHPYAAAGTYVVTLTITDSANHTFTTSKSIAAP
jgi:PKD repeat protein